MGTADKHSVASAAEARGYARGRAEAIAVLNLTVADLKRRAHDTDSTLAEVIDRINAETPEER